MGFGEIGSMYVRIRPLLGDFAGETTAGIEAAIRGAQVEVDSFTKGMVGASVQQISANLDVAASYKEIGDAAVTGSVEQRSAYTLAVESAQRASALMVGASDAAARATLDQIDAQRTLARAALEAAGAVDRAASDEVIASAKAADATDAVVGANERVAVTAKATGATAGEGIVAGLKSKLLNVGTLFGVGIGADLFVHLARDTTAAAATAQISNKVIQEEFGKSAQAVIDFANSTRETFNILPPEAQSVAAQFGLIFNQMKVGTGAAATMTEGWEKLVGAIAETRGVDPSTLLANITKAAEGNARGLKTLGITENTVTQNQQAMNDGWGDSVSKLTPAEKAIVTYQLAIATLGERQKTARENANSYANVQLGLNKAWDGAKVAIGTALLPTFTKLVGELGRWLTRMTQGGEITRDVNDAIKDTGKAFRIVEDVLGPVVDTLKTLVHALGGAKDAAELFVAAFAANKLIGIANTINTTLTGAYNKVKKAIADAGNAATAASAKQRAAASVAEGANAGVVASNETVTGSVRGVVVAEDTVGPAAEANATVAEAANAGLVVSFTTVKAAVLSLIGSTGIGLIVIALSIAAVEIIQHWSTVKGWFEDFVSWLGGVWQPVLAVVTLGFSLAVTDIIDNWGAVERWFEKFAGDFAKLFTHPIASLEDMFGDLKTAVEGIFHSLADEVLRVFGGLILDILDLLAKIPTKISAFGVSIGITNPFSKYASELKTYLTTLNGVGSASAQQLADEFGDPKSLDAVQAAAKKVKKVITDTVTGASTGGETAAEADTGMADKLAEQLFNRRVADAISNAGLKVRQAFVTAGQGIKTSLDSLQNYIISGEERLATEQTATTQKVAAIAQSATANITKIGNDLAKAAGQLIQNNIELGTGPTNAALSAAETALQTSLLSGKGAGNIALLTQQVQRLTSSVDVKGNTARIKQTVEEHINDLIHTAQTGHLGVKALITDLTSYLNSQGLTFKNAGQSLGSAFAAGMQADIEALKEQFKQLGYLTPEQRRAAVHGVTSGLGPKVVNVHQELQDLRLRLRDEHAAYMRGLAQHERALTLAEQRGTKTETDALLKQSQLLATESLSVQREHYTVANQQTALLQKIAASSAAIASLGTSTTGFPSTTEKILGRHADDARAAAKRSVR